MLDRVAKKVAQSTGSTFDAKNVIEVFVSVFADVFEPDGDFNAGEMSVDNIVYIATRYTTASEQLAKHGYPRTSFTSDLVSKFIAFVGIQINDKNPPLSQTEVDENVLLEIEALKHYNFEATIMAPRLRVSEKRGHDIVMAMFNELDTKNGYLLMPEDFRVRYERASAADKKRRVVCDFIAGMTDRYAAEFHGRLFSEDPESIFKPL